MSKVTPLPTIAMRGWAGSPPGQLDQARVTLLRCRDPDGMDHRITLRQRIATRDGQRRAMPFRECLGDGFEIGGAAVGGGGVDQIADGGGGFGQAQAFRRAGWRRR